VRQEDLRRLFQRDAAEAWSVLTRDQPPGPAPQDGVSRLVVSARVFFLGLSYKLSPPRRLLFAAALVFAGFGLVGGFSFGVSGGGWSLSLESAPLWYLLAVGSLVFLLALELVDRVRVRDELEVARQLQVDLLPRMAPEVPGYGFAHAYRTANEVGGDYYDFRVLPDGRLALVIGDASGHGMAAGLLMAIANATLHTALDLDPAPTRVAAILNRALYRAGDRRAFMSVFYALLEPATGGLDYVCAGHPFPVLRRADGRVEELGDGGLPLGIRADLVPVVSHTRVHPGDLLLLYTDGLPEAVDGEDQAFGFESLADHLAPGRTPEQVRDALLAAFDRHRGERAPGDDLSLVVMVRHAGPPPPPPPPAPGP
jgi:hypothetical protein